MVEPNLTYDYIQEKLRDVVDFDSGDIIGNVNGLILNGVSLEYIFSLYSHLWKVKHGIPSDFDSLFERLDSST